MQTNRPTKALDKVVRASERHNKVCAEAWGAYLNSIRAAREAGHTLSEIGNALGCTKANVHYLLNPDPRKEQADG
jgi:predicted transcriptional regulator